MKKHCLLVFHLLASVVLKAQTFDSVKMSTNDTTLFTIAQKNPEFPGGMEKLYRFLGTVVQYPAVAKENNVKGTVIIRIVVEKDGSLSNIKVVKSVSKELDDEVIRIFNLCPKWNPAIENGRIVRCTYTVPYSFRMVKDD